MMTKKEFKILEYRVDKIACGMQFYYCDLQPKFEADMMALKIIGLTRQYVNQMLFSEMVDCLLALCQIPGDSTHWCEPHRLSIV